MVFPDGLCLRCPPTPIRPSNSPSVRLTVMNRDAAYALLCEYTQTENLRRHMLAVEAAMRAYARKFGEVEEKWRIVGLLHDFDYERWPTLTDRTTVP